MAKEFVLLMLKSGIALSLFYFFYYLFLKRLSFHSLKRYYLLGSLLVSLALPFFHFPFDSYPDLQNINEFILIDEELSVAAEGVMNQVNDQAPALKQQPLPYLFICYLAGAILLLIRTLYSIWSQRKLIRNAELQYIKGYNVYTSPDIKDNYSFFTSIFLQSNLSAYDQDIIIQHEAFHIRKRHGLDLVLCEILVLLQWFNPFIYRIRNAMKEVHEFEADQALTRSGNELAYQQLLLQHTASRAGFSLTSSFHSFTLKRLQMMTKSKSRKRHLVALTLLLPLIALMILSFTRIPPMPAAIQDLIQEESKRFTPRSSHPTQPDTSFFIDENTQVTIRSSKMLKATGTIEKPLSTMQYTDVFIVIEDKEYQADTAIYDANTKHLKLKGNVMIFIRDAKLKHTPSIYPVDTVHPISAGYGERKHPITGEMKFHRGVDIPAPKGTPVYATADGVVNRVDNNPKGAGKFITINHGPVYSTMYSQLSVQLVKKGQEVKRGDIIGHVGSSGMSTGPHLHYEIKKNGKNVDPMKYFQP